MSKQTSYEESMHATVIRKDKPSVNSHVKVSGPITVTSGIATIGKEKTRDVSKRVYQTLDNSDDVSDMKNSITYVSRSLANKITMSRTAKGLTRAQLGARANLLTSDIDGVENAKSVYKQSVIGKINKALGTSFTKRD